MGEYYEDARHIKHSHKIAVWTENNIVVKEAFTRMPTNKTARMDRFEPYVRRLTAVLDDCLQFEHKPFRKFHIRSYIFKQKKLRSICRTHAPTPDTILGFGDWRNYDPDGKIEKSRSNPVKPLQRMLEHTVVA